MTYKIHTIKEIIPATGKEVKFHMPSEFARCKRIFVTGNKPIDMLEGELKIGGKKILPLGFNFALIRFSHEIPFNQNGIEIDEPASNQLVEIKILEHNLPGSYHFSLDIYFLNE